MAMCRISGFEMMKNRVDDVPFDVGAENSELIGDRTPLSVELETIIPADRHATGLTFRALKLTLQYRPISIIAKNRCPAAASYGAVQCSYPNTLLRLLLDTVISVMSAIRFKQQSPSPPQRSPKSSQKPYHAIHAFASRADSPRPRPGTTMTGQRGMDLSNLPFS